MTSLIGHKCPKDGCDQYLIDERWRCPGCGSRFTKQTYKRAASRGLPPEAAASNALLEMIRSSQREFMGSLEKIWGGMEGPIMIVCSSRPVGHTGLDGFWAGWGVWAVLAWLYGPECVSIHVSEDFQPGDSASLSANLVLIGGGRRNAFSRGVLRTLWERGEISYRFVPYHQPDQSGKVRVAFALHDRRGEVRSWKRGDATKSPVWDNAIAVKTHNPFARDRAVFILAGCHTLGTQGAIAALLSGRVVQAVSDLFDDGPFELLLRAGRIHNPHATTVELRRPRRLVLSLHRSHLELAPEDSQTVLAALMGSGIAGR